jgi:hypothetical protein
MELLKEDSGKSDSLIYWLEKSPATKMEFVLNYNGRVDTIKPLYKNFDAKNGRPDLSVESNITAGKLYPETDLKLTVSEPIDSINMNKIKFLDKDSNLVFIEQPTIKLKDVNFKTFENNTIRSMILDSAAITSIYGNVNSKELIFAFENHPVDFYGALVINVDTIFQTPVMLDVLDDKGELFLRQKLMTTQVFKQMIPGKYGLRLIFDTDNNGEWTTGSLSEKKLPEKTIIYQGFIEVKSRWEKEIDWNLKVVNNGEN